MNGAAFCLGQNTKCHRLWGSKGIRTLVMWKYEPLLYFHRIFTAAGKWKLAHNQLQFNTNVLFIFVTRILALLVSSQSSFRGNVLYARRLRLCRKNILFSPHLLLKSKSDSWLTFFETSKCTDSLFRNSWCHVNVALSSRHLVTSCWVHNLHDDSFWQTRVLSSLSLI